MRLVTLGCKGAEIVLAAEWLCRASKHIQVEWPPERPLEPAAKGRGSRIVQSDVISIATSQSGFPSMEARLHRVDRLDPAVARKESVESTTEGMIRPTRRSAEADGLPNRVDARIGPARGMGDSSMTKDALKYPLEFSLYRAASRLALPPHKAGAVIV
jgi:hypothetical protein